MRTIVGTCLLLALASTSQAATREWRGTGANQLWSNPDNWVLNQLPADGDDLIFPVTAEPFTSTNDLTNLIVHSFTISSKRTFTGNGIRLQAGMTLSGTGTPVTFDLPIQLTGNQTWTNPSLELVLTPLATIDLNGQPLAIDGQATLNGVISGTGALIKNGAGNTALTLNAVNTYAGPTTVNGGILAAPLPTSLGVSDGTVSNSTTTAANTLVTLGAGVYAERFSLSGNLNGGGNVQTELTGPITITGDVKLMGPGDMPAARLIVSSVIDGSGRLRLGGQDSKVTLRNTNTYTGGTVFDTPSMTSAAEVRLEADEAIGAAPAITLVSRVSIYLDKKTQTFGDISSVSPLISPRLNLISTAVPGERATLILAGTGDATHVGGIDGEGTIRHTGSGRQVLNSVAALLGGSAISAEHGTLQLNSPFAGTSSITGDGSLVLTNEGGSYGALTMTSGTLVFRALLSQAPSLSATGGTVEFTGSGTQLGRVTVPGAVTLTNSTLSLSLPDTFAPTLGTQYPLIDHSTAGLPITGTFVGLPEGTEFRSGRFGFRISYVGGDGNDVVLTVTKISRDYLLSEGATGGFFKTDILIANPNNAEVQTKVQFFPTGASPISMDVTMPALSRKTITANDVAGLSAAEFSTLVSALDGSHLAVERTMSWNNTAYGSHTDHAAEALSTTWYFAEGSQGFFQTYLLLANPQPTANTATVEYLRTGDTPITRIYDLTPNSRRTIDISQDAALVNTSFGITVTFAQPGMAERSMYFGTTPFFSGGHESAGVTSTSTTWFVPEGATGSFFETFILLSNPGTTAVDATLTFLPAAGSTVTKQVSIPAKGRTTVNIEQQDASLSNAAVATQVAATGPVIVERAQYWPDPPPNWYEAHNSFGVTALGMKWALAEGRVGTTANYQTYVLLANPGDVQAQVLITFLRDGKPSLDKVFNVPAKSRFNVQIAGLGSLVPELQDETFGASITSNRPIAVERAMYNDSNGVVWAAGSSATAVPIP